MTVYQTMYFATHLVSLYPNLLQNLVPNLTFCDLVPALGLFIGSGTRHCNRLVANLLVQDLAPNLLSNLVSGLV